MKTIKARLVGASVVIVCVIFLVVSISVFFALGHIYKNREGEYICNTAERLSKIASTVMGKTSAGQWQFADILELVYEDDIEAYSRSSGYYIITADKYKRVVFSSSNVKDIIVEKGYPSDYISYVLEGNSIKGTSDMSVYFGKSVITAAEPVYSQDEVVGAVICCLPTDYLSKLRMGTMGSVLLVLLPILLICLIASYFFAERIINPITKVSKAAKLIAGGDLSQRVDFSSENELGELAANFNEMAITLENADRMKNSFIADVSHELRTPMTSIIGFLQGIRDGVIPPEEQGKYIGICLEESRRLSRLISRLLDVARLESGENELDEAVFDVNEVIRSTIFKFEEIITEKKLRVNADFSAKELFVFADKDGIERVFTNLLDNATKFAPEGGTIYISSEAKNNKAQLLVSNSGQGIAQEDIQSIWDKFYKGDKSRSHDRSGTGLGLYFVKKIINNHGERITVSCEENLAEQTIYTNFKFELKLSEKESL